MIDNVIPELKPFSIEDFIAAFGAADADYDLIAEEAQKYEFMYRRLNMVERDQVILDIFTKIDGFTKVGAHRGDIWESCWSDAKKKFLANSDEIDSLDPEFMGAHPIVRLGRDYARPEDHNFETYWFRVMRHWLFARYLDDVDCVMEFGCGSGFNLAKVGSMYPDKVLMGLDWSLSSVELVNDIAAQYNLKLTGRKFDFFNPDSTLDINENSAVMTFAALEQTGSKFIQFAKWLLEKKPRIVISMEPIIEFYDENHLVDFMALKYHRHREYLDGYYSWVKSQAEAGLVEVIKEKRPQFGSMYHEGYSVLIWRPL